MKYPAIETPNCPGVAQQRTSDAFRRAANAISWVVACMGVALLLALLVIQLHALNQSVLISQAVRSVSTEQFADGFTGWQAAGWAVNIQIALSLTLSLAPLWLPKGFTWFIGSQNCASSSRSS